MNRAGAVATLFAAACLAPADSFPFVVGVTDNVPDAVVLSQRFETFPDRCGPVVATEPVPAG